MGQISDCKKGNGVEEQLWKDKQLPTTSVGQRSQSHPQSWKSGGRDAEPVTVRVPMKIIFFT